MNLDLDPWLLLPLALVLFLMALPILSRRIKGKVNYTTTGELNNLLAQDRTLVLIDIRSEKEFNSGHIEGAVNISPATLKDKVQKGGPDFEELKHQAVVVVCHSDIESIGIVKALDNAGFGNASVLQGGMLRWKRDRRSVKKG
ncbi:MAG: rhodanese-like domain-containing protein [Rhodospirillaceae bacterium]|nr:rhodanese-like domain-containing protein [Rhodospirillaceae bacterium]MBL6930554.1 rhodanese-like domain-containing protein [Rhodospirillales bacterium]